MKKIRFISKSGLVTLWVLFLLYETSHAQSPYTGIWEGNFMEQFKTVLLLDQVEGNAYAGKIIMFNGETRIQDDELSKITIEDRELCFYIAAKESSFKGTFNEADKELSGNFIFPDNSRHPLILRKFEKDSTAIEVTTPGIRESLKQSFPVEELKSDFRDLIDKLKKYHTKALFIGEQPGSSFLCNDWSIQLQLPHTGMEVNIPRTTFVTAVSGFSAKEPFPLDYEVNITTQDLLSGTDTYLDYVNELLTE